MVSLLAHEEWRRGVTPRARRPCSRFPLRRTPKRNSWSLLGRLRVTSWAHRRYCSGTCVAPSAVAAVLCPHCRCGAVQWAPTVSYSDWLFGSTTAFAAQYASQNMSNVESGVDVPFTPLTENGVAAAGAGSLWTYTLTKSLSSCTILNASADACVTPGCVATGARALFAECGVPRRIMFGDAGLSCPDGVTVGTQRMLALLRALDGTSTVFGPVSFNAFQMVRPPVTLVVCRCVTRSLTEHRNALRHHTACV